MKLHNTVMFSSKFQSWVVIVLRWNTVSYIVIITFKSITSCKVVEYYLSYFIAKVIILDCKFQFILYAYLQIMLNFK